MCHLVLVFCCFCTEADFAHEHTNRFSFVNFGDDHTFRQGDNIYFVNPPSQTHGAKYQKKSFYSMFIPN